MREATSYTVPFPFWKGHHSELFLLHVRKKKSKGRFLDTKTTILLPSLAFPVNLGVEVRGDDPQVQDMLYIINSNATAVSNLSSGN